MSKTQSERLPEHRPQALIGPGARDLRPGTVHRMSRAECGKERSRRTPETREVSRETEEVLVGAGSECRT